ncbi:hypothetical protein GCM10009799_22520 [Nocardiopsis rhodophaea]|uniref:WXG100 family type VII secretion target n=1 Tax=Nocardiopsis rhodophaea TaxID=280238 RepID=A0ABP5ED08_9ACTN
MAEGPAGNPEPAKQKGKQTVEISEQFKDIEQIFKKACENAKDASGKQAVGDGYSLFRGDAIGVMMKVAEHGKQMGGNIQVAGGALGATDDENAHNFQRSGDAFLKRNPNVDL